MRLRPDAPPPNLIPYEKSNRPRTPSTTSNRTAAFSQEIPEERRRTSLQETDPRALTRVEGKTNNCVLDPNDYKMPPVYNLVPHRNSYERNLREFNLRQLVSYQQGLIQGQQADIGELSRVITEQRKVNATFERRFDELGSAMQVIKGFCLYIMNDGKNEKKKLEEKITELSTEKDTALNQRDTAITQRDTVTAQRDNAITQRDTVTAQRDTAITQRDTVTAQRDTALNQRDNAVLARANAIILASRLEQDRDTAITQRNNARNQVHTITTQRDTARAERDTAIIQSETVTAQRDTARAERDQALQQLQAILVERNAAIAERNAVIAERDNLQMALQQEEHKSNERLTNIQAKDATIEDLNRRIRSLNNSIMQDTYVFTYLGNFADRIIASPFKALNNIFGK